MPRPGNGNGGGGNGSGSIRGNNRDNLLTDTAGNDLMDGRAGNDTLVSTGGDDTMIGGSGADVFVMNDTSGTVTISDFEDGVDLLDITSFGFLPDGSSTQGYWGELEAYDNDTHIVIYDLSGEAPRIVLEGIHHTQISIDDYIL
jgi:Ca2+-binding RTX toxin-like protein